MMDQKPDDSDFIHITTQDRMMRSHRGPGSGSVSVMSEPVDRESVSATAGAGVNVKELAAEIVKNMRQDPVTGRQVPNLNLNAVPEDVVAESINRGLANANMARTPGGAESTSLRSGTTAPRQLPIPPVNSQFKVSNRQPEDTFSVDTLPAYAGRPF